MDLTTEQYRLTAEILGVVLIIAENILPHLPTKANSVTQLVINILKTVLARKAK